MVERKNLKEERKYLVFLIIITFLYFLVFFLRPNILNFKDNDLGRNYIPIFSYIKESYFRNLSFPLWKSDQMIGESFISDPLSTLTYPFNLVLLISPLIYFPAIYYLFHFSLSAISAYFLARTFSFSKISAFASAIIYTFSIKTLLHVTAGHITMVAAFCYFPLAFLSLRKILNNANTPWILLMAASLSFMLNLYATVFYYSIIFLTIYSVYFFVKRKEFTFKTLKKFLYAGILCLALSAIFLIPQMEFSRLSSRSNLTIYDVAIPLWNLKKFLLSLFLPYLIFKNLDHESFLYLGFIPIIFSAIGFLFLPKNKKILLLAFLLLSLLFAAGLSTPIFKIAYYFLPLLKYSRVTTRFWFLLGMVAALLSGLAIERIKQKKVAFIAIGLFLLETTIVSYVKINATTNLNFENTKLYEYLAHDKDIFRVYCTSYCFNPQLTSKYNLELLNGENPIQNKSYLEFLQKAGNYEFNQFAVIFPPYQVWQATSPPQPNSEELGKANVKYVASTYHLQGEDFLFLGKFENINLYENLKFQKRAYFQDSQSNVQIEKKSENSLIFTYSKLQKPESLIISDFYYPGWKAFTEGKKLQIENYDNVFQEINVPQLSDKVELKFEPTSYLVGKSITFSTVLFLLIYFWYKKSHRQNG